MPITFWVSPHLDEWHVQKDGTGQSDTNMFYEGSFDARDDAVAWACRVAQRRAPCIVRVQDDEGNITAQYAFESARDQARSEASGQLGSR